MRLERGVCWLEAGRPHPLVVRSGSSSLAVWVPTEAKVGEKARLEGASHEGAGAGMRLLSLVGRLSPSPPSVLQVLEAVPDEIVA